MLTVNINVTVSKKNLAIQIYSQLSAKFYCIKENSPLTSDSKDLPTVENNQSHLLTATCDTFIKTLDELMDLADTQLNIYGGGPLENGTRRVRIFLFY